MKEKKKKRNYCDHGLNPAFLNNNFGERYDRAVQKNALPAVGAKVIVYECRQYANLQESHGIAAEYVPSDSYKSARNVPRIFTVEGYTKGEERALDPANRVILSYVVGDVKLKSGIPTLWIATGNMLLREVREEIGEMLKDRLIISYGYYEEKRRRLARAQ